MRIEDGPPGLEQESAGESNGALEIERSRGLDGWAAKTGCAGRDQQPRSDAGWDAAGLGWEVRMGNWMLSGWLDFFPLLRWPSWGHSAFSHLLFSRSPAPVARGLCT